ncbi:g11774 [Coccomyxa elongata]
MISDDFLRLPSATDLVGCSCQYALGGGAVAPGGSYPQAQIISSTCASQLHKYLVKQYDHDVETAIASARAYFDSYPRQANASQIIVLDIDETALSNRAEWLTALEGIRGGGIVPSLQGHALEPLRAAMAPALQPMLDLYTDLYKAGFSLTFITGRRDYGMGREATAKNLEVAGYGVPCSHTLGEAQHAERVQQEPCYVALGMRGEGDQRLASVYKPDQRAQLQEKGYEIMASFGDQWSDLAGTSAAVASFKLPNPFYYIL